MFSFSSQKGGHRSISKNGILRSVIAVGVFVPIGMGLTSFLSYSSTPSLNHRFFLIWPSRLDGLGGSRVENGDYVRFPHQDKETGGKVIYMMKRVGCRAGQALSVVGRDYYCDGGFIGRAKERNTKGEAVSNFVWNGTVPVGNFFAVADHRDSYDSRYYGFVPVEKITNKALPLF